MPDLSHTTLARLACDETTARRVADRLADSFEAAVAAFEGPDGWSVEAHFAEAPDEAAVRACVVAAAGDSAGAARAFPGQVGST